MALYRWMCGLGLGLGLTGCGLFEGVPPLEKPPPDRAPPEVPKWVEDNPLRGNANEVLIRAQTIPGLRVEFFSGSSSTSCLGTPAQSIKADEQGIAAARFQVADNSSTYFRVRARAGADKTSGCSEAHVYKEDSTPPRAPQWAADLPTHSSSNTLSLAVSVERGSRVSLFGSGDCGGAALATTTAGEADGTNTSPVTVTFPVTVEDDTTNRFSVSAADDLGNTSCSAAFTFTEDSTPPESPVLRATDPVSPSRLLQPSILGTAEPGVTVLLYKTEECSGLPLVSGEAGTQGGFQLSLRVDSDRTTLVRARARDAAGNLSGCSDALAYVSDNTEPAAPTFQRFQPAPPANDNAPLLIGTSEPGSRVWIYAGNFCRGEPVASAMADAQGLFQATLSVVDDVTLEFSALAVDAAGNVGWCHLSTLEYVEDSTAPSVSSVKLSPSRPSNGNLVSLTGTATSHAGESYGTALLFTTPDCQGMPVDTSPMSSGGFTVDTTVPDDSTTLLSVIVKDKAGNASACAGPWTFVEDSTPPSRAGATVTDGPAEDLSYQLSGDSVEAHWTGFSDEQGLGPYEHFLSRRTDCSGGAVTLPVTLQEARVRLDNLGLSDDTYFHCVRAQDLAGNRSAWVASNGFRVDLAPPTVTGTTPQPEEQEVDLIAPIRVTFSEPVDTSTLTSGTFEVRINGALVAGTVACESATACAFTPAGPLPYREQVDVWLSAAVRDLAGRTLPAPHGMSFTTRGRVWAKEPLPVSAVRPGLSPDIALDGQGHALAVWVQGVGDTFRPYAAGYVPYVGWSTPQELDTLNLGDVDPPAVAMNAAGSAVAAWVLRNGAQADLYVAEYASGGGWSTPQVVESRAEPVSTPRVVVDGAGNALVVWRQSDGTAESVWAARRVVGVGWSAPLLLESGSGAASVPALAAVGSGGAVAAWTQPDGGGVVRVWASRFAPDTGWTAPEQAAAEGDGSPVAAALSLDGSAVVVFRTLSEADGTRAWATRYVPGTGWSTPASLLGSAIPGTEEVSVAMDRWGRAIAAWAGFDASRRAVFLERFTPESGWQQVQLVTGTAGYPVVAADGQGNFHVLWVENIEGNDRVVRALYPEGAIALSPSAPLEPDHAGTSKRPRLGTNSDGDAAAVWYRDNGTGFFGNLAYTNLYQ